MCMSTRGKKPFGPWVLPLCSHSSHDGFQPRHPRAHHPSIPQWRSKYYRLVKLIGGVLEEAPIFDAIGGTHPIFIPSVFPAMIHIYIICLIGRDEAPPR